MDPNIAEELPLPPGDLFFEDEENGTPDDDKFCREEADVSTPEAYDQYLSAEASLPHEGEMMKATVKSHKRDHNGDHVAALYPTERRRRDGNYMSSDVMAQPIRYL